MHFWCGIFCHHSKPTSPFPDHASLLVGLPAVVLATLAASDFFFSGGGGAGVGGVSSSHSSAQNLQVP